MSIASSAHSSRPSWRLFCGYTVSEFSSPCSYLESISGMERSLSNPPQLHPPLYQPLESCICLLLIMYSRARPHKWIQQYFPQPANFRWGLVNHVLFWKQNQYNLIQEGKTHLLHCQSEKFRHKYFPKINSRIGEGLHMFSKLPWDIFHHDFSVGMVSLLRKTRELYLLKSNTDEVTMKL